ncbi:hypothetical protein EVAR_86690_1 [Eumeta japonica]|uniref:CHK kinase-like domain-containing protein n=1 Tax=Eumeta variegata TaxID=151549 RepID=A0A4C1XYT6_EUMVA|nr:hypothetical protein EVAR_86690_1 [Eumeta japonica]
MADKEKVLIGILKSAWEYAAARPAKLHALSYAFAENDPDGFAKVVSERRSLFDGSSDQIKEMWKKSEANALNLVPENLKDRLVAFLSKESGLDNFEKYFSSFQRPVLVHGDYRSSNLFHRRKNGKLDSLIPIDYQMFHAGTPIIDLLYFIISGTDGDFRKYHYRQLINHYYDTFASFLKKFALDPYKLYPREHFDEDLKRTLPWGMLVVVYFLPLNLVEAEKALTLDGNASMVNAVQSNDLYRNRLLEWIRDYIEWGIM